MIGSSTRLPYSTNPSVVMRNTPVLYVRTLNTRRSTTGSRATHSRTRNPTSVLAEIATRLPGAISVAAVDPQKNRAFYSSTGSYIELAAPGGTSRGFGRGGFIFQQTFDFTFTDTFDPTVVPPSQYRAPRFDVLANIGIVGTSMATPHVSGIAAMLVQQGITDPAAIEDALEKSAVDIGTPGRDNSFGFGLVDARNALRGLGLSR